MKKLDENEIIKLWNEFISAINKHFTGSRKDNILKMSEAFSDRIMLAPASYRENYHSCYPGGYLVHILNVYNIAMKLSVLWDEYAPTKDYTNEEIAFVSLFHDLGKIGDELHEFYQPQDNEWRRNNLGEIYKINSEIENMNGADRALYLLQKFDIKLSKVEWISIKVHEGMYDDANVYYLKTSMESNTIKSHLPHLIHQADMIALRAEYEEWKNIYSKDSNQKNVAQQKYTKKKTATDVLSTAMSDGKFSVDDLFEDKFSKKQTE